MCSGVCTMAKFAMAISHHSTDSHLPSLRQAISRRVLLLALVQVVLALLVARWQLLPQLEALQIGLNDTLARNVAQSTERALVRPLQSMGANARVLNQQHVRTESLDQSVVQALAQSHPVAESVFLLDTRGRVRVIAYNGENSAAVVDRIGLDLSSSAAFADSYSAPVTISTVYLSPVSEQATVAVSASLADGGRLVMELSLARLARLNRVVQDSSGLNVLIVDDNGYIVADMNSDKPQHNAMLPIEALRAVQAQAAASIDYDGQRWFASSTPVNLGRLQWRVLVLRPATAVFGPVTEIVLMTVSSIVLVMALSYLVMLLFTRGLTQAAETLAVHAQEFSDGRVPQQRNLRFRDLFHVDKSMRSMALTLRQREQALRQMNEELEQRVQQRTIHLQKANAELEQTMQKLASTQSELVQAGKMSALGSMVAGIAHEMNTPVGNARLVATTLRDTARQMERDVRSGKVSRSQLLADIESVSAGTDLVDRSLERAADLVQSFKQVAVDQTSNRRRVFSLQEVIHENEVLLAPRLRGAGASVHVHAPAEKLMMESYPGALGQVVTNLIENALVHGYAGRSGGQIDVRVEPFDDHQVQVQVSDHGRGIPPESLGRVFDPFFTTRLGQGGSGLGLSIVYGLVTRTLGGRIGVESTPGQGTTFSLVLPLQGPEEAESASAHTATPPMAA